MFPPEILQAACHLRWLYDRGYPSAASVKLVGDRHRLPREYRLILLRGVSSGKDAERRRGMITKADELAGRSLVVDGHNVVLTVANYLAGVKVFEADDGLLRDIGMLHGRVHDSPLMNRALDLVAQALNGIVAVSYQVVFDSSVSHSRDHARYLRGRLERRPAVIEVVRSGDRAVIESAAEVISTSDSALIGRAGRPVLDLARLVLEGAFHPELDSFTDIGGNCLC